MTLTYWVADALKDSRAYSIRCRTRRECRAVVAAQGEYAKGYDAPRKVTVTYKDAFDLVNRALGEGSFE